MENELDTNEWVIKRGNFMRPSKGDYIVPIKDCMRIFTDDYTPQQRKEECDRLYNEWFKNNHG